MNTKEQFHSSLAEAMNDFVSFKRMQGYNYTSTAETLGLFDRFLVEKGFDAPLLQNDIIRQYELEVSCLKPPTQQNRLSAVHLFSLHLNAHCPESACSPEYILPAPDRQPRFYRISDQQVGDLMDAAKTLRMVHPVGPQLIRFLVGMLYCTGLRIREALNLNLGDIDLNRGTLFVRKGKFGKDRLVAMLGSTCVAVKEWLDLRSAYAADTALSPLLIGHLGTRLKYGVAYDKFRKVCQYCNMTGDPPPRLHDLRHNYACRCIQQWRETGKEVQALLPVLAKAMGHVDIYSTQVYIHIDADDLQQASTRFSQHIHHQSEVSS